MENFVCMCVIELVGKVEWRRGWEEERADASSS